MVRLTSSSLQHVSAEKVARALRYLRKGRGTTIKGPTWTGVFHLNRTLSDGLLRRKENTG